MNNSIRLAALIVCAVAFSTCTDLLFAQKNVDEAFFEEQVRPVLIERCIKCHGLKKQEGELRLDSRPAALTGGESGPAVIPGKPGESLLVDAIQHGALEMPPQEKLEDQQIADVIHWIKTGAVWPDSSKTLQRASAEFTAEERAHWAFQPIKQVDPPRLESGWPKNEIDYFVLDRLNQNNLSPAAETDRRTLIRRLTFQLTGLPPTPAEIERFLTDESPTAFQTLVDALLDRPEFGERWAQHWLDLVRYADSDGYKADFFRPFAWRYRDYVIDALNANKPFDQFIREQIAGDEIAPGNPEALAATGYLRCGIYEFNQRDVRTHWSDMLDDITEVTADAFLGLSFNCARCHDHKFDPILQKDFYRLRAFFAPLRMSEDLPLATPAQLAAYEQQMQIWREKTGEMRAKLAEIEQPILAEATQSAYMIFPKEIRDILDLNELQRTTYEQQLAELAYRQIVDEQEKVDFNKKLKDEKLALWKQLTAELDRHKELRPADLPLGRVATDVSNRAPETFIPGEGTTPVEPGYLSIVQAAAAEIPPAQQAGSTGRRTALANWLVCRENPFTARVMVNRVWQMHFGHGIVLTPNNFGKLGGEPSHPALLDYLASRFIESGWDLKGLHRLIVNSATYRQASITDQEMAGAKIDPTNRLLWRQNRQRLDGEEIRDTVLHISGTLEPTHGGAAVDLDKPRRSIYLKAWRNDRDPLVEAFDLPERTRSVGQRNVTITAPQALTLMNGPWLHGKAADVAKQLEASAADVAKQVQLAYRLAYGRDPSSEEMDESLRYIEEINSMQGGSTAAAQANAGLTRICHAIMNSSEFLFVD